MLAVFEKLGFRVTHNPGDSTLTSSKSSSEGPRASTSGGESAMMSLSERSAG